MPGQIGWIDLTVPDATALRDFYQGVTGWTPSSVDMGGYQDFCMHPAGENLRAFSAGQNLTSACQTASIYFNG